MIKQHAAISLDHSSHEPLPRGSRSGKVLVMIAVSLSAILGIVGLVFDAGLMTTDAQNLHHAADAGAEAAAMDLRLGKSSSQAVSTAQSYIRDLNGISGAHVTVNIPPSQGSFAGHTGFVEVIATAPYGTRIVQAIGSNTQQSLSARAVAGYQSSTADSAINVLDPNPSQITIDGASVPLALPALPAILGGLEVLGLGTVKVDGAVLVNTQWGGVDEKGQPAGNAAGPPYGVSCTPLLGLTKLTARDIRVSGGVDNQSNYADFVAGQASPLKANRLAVPDPYKSLPVPSTSVDSANVNAQYRGSKQVLTLPIIPTTLQPGVYDWIEIDSGLVTFKPGVYIIRSVNPTTNIALSIVGGTVTANGVMFYITNSAAYDATSGSPDSSDLETRPATSATTLVPSVVINTALLGSSFSPLSDAGSPFNGLLVYQRRMDPRPILVVNQNLLLGGSISGAFYAKWGHVLFTGSGNNNVTIAAGTVRLITLLGMTITPQSPLPPAQDVFLVE